MTKNRRTQTKSFFQDRKTQLFPAASKALIAMALFAQLIGCAKASDDGEWASGEPDTTQDVNPPAEEPTPPGPTPIVTPTPDVEEPSQPPLPDLHFSFLPGTHKLAHGLGKTWDGCDKDAMVRGGYDSDTKCGNGTILPAYAEHLNKHFFACVEKGALSAGYPQPERVFIRHWGTYVDRDARNSTSLSMHAYARAIDIVKFILFDRNGKSTPVSTNARDYKGATAKFYDSFRRCWKGTLPSSCKPGQREYNGSIGIPGSDLGGNSLHNDHIHLSFPFCAG